jgi:hypothetical protein
MSYTHPTHNLFDRAPYICIDHLVGYSSYDRPNRSRSRSRRRSRRRSRSRSSGRVVVVCVAGEKVVRRTLKKIGARTAW